MESPKHGGYMIKYKQNILIIVLLVVIAVLWVFSYKSISYGAPGEAGSGVEDPTIMGVGARQLGTGRSFGALLDDATVVFNNPGNLGLVKGLNLSAGQANFIGDINHYQGAVVLPTKLGTVGLGMHYIVVGDITRTTTSITGLGSFKYTSKVYILSYGLPKISIGENSKISVGGSMKLFEQGFDLDVGSGRGINMDVGVNWQINEWLNLSAGFQNILPTGIGFDTGITEPLNTEVELGLGMRMLEDRIRIGVAATKELGTSERIALHVGAELWPVEFLALRGGLDQTPKPYGVQNDYGLGVGLNYRGFILDVAYRTQADSLKGNPTYFANIGYGRLKPKVWEGKPLLRLMNLPNYRSKTYQPQIDIGMEVNGVKRLMVNDDEILIIKGINEYTKKLELKTGRNKFVVKYEDSKNNVKEIGREVFLLPKYKDIGNNYWGKNEVEMISSLRVLNGFKDGKFKPDTAVKRKDFGYMLKNLLGIKKEMEGWKGEEEETSESKTKNLLNDNNMYRNVELISSKMRVLDNLNFKDIKNDESGNKLKIIKKRYEKAGNGGGAAAVENKAEDKSIMNAIKNLQKWYLGKAKKGKIKRLEAIVAMKKIGEAISLNKYKLKRLPYTDIKITADKKSEDANEIKKFEKDNIKPKYKKYYDDIRWAYDAGMLECFSNKYLMPNEPVTRAELASMLFKLKEINQLARGLGLKPTIAGAVPFLKIISPENNYKTRESEIIIKGLMADGNYMVVGGNNLVFIDEEEIVSPEPEFTVKVKLNRGENIIKLKVRGKSETNIEKELVIYRI